MNIEKISLTVIAGRLERAIHCDVGMKGLNILLCGWNNFRARHNYGCINFAARARDTQGEEGYLFLDELVAFSRYAGYDLTKE
jgi:hypothetical protein